MLLHTTSSRPRAIKQSLLEAPLLSIIPWLAEPLYAAFYPPNYHQTDRLPDAPAYAFLTTRLMELRTDMEQALCVNVASTTRGKSTSWMVMKLVHFLSRHHQRVLVMDADFSWPTLHLAFDLAYDSGLSFVDLLRHCHPEMNWAEMPNDFWRRFQEQCHSSSDLPGVTLLHNTPALKSATEAQQTLTDNLALLPSLLSYLKPHFDWIVMDTGPLTATPENRELCAIGDGLVLLEDRLFNEKERRALHQILLDDNIHVLGRVKRH